MADSRAGDDGFAAPRARVAATIRRLAWAKTYSHYFRKEFPAECPKDRDGARILASKKLSSTDQSRENMNKGEFVEALADSLDVSRAQADRALTAVLDIIAERMAAGEKVSFTGFGSFEVSERAARSGRNPQTGATIEIAAARVPKFSAGATLKAAVNGK